MYVIPVIFMCIFIYICLEGTLKRSRKKGVFTKIGSWRFVSRPFFSNEFLWAYKGIRKCSSHSDKWYIHYCMQLLLFMARVIIIVAWFMDDTYCIFGHSVLVYYIWHYEMSEPCHCSSHFHGTFASIPMRPNKQNFSIYLCILYVIYMSAVRYLFTSIYEKWYQHIISIISYIIDFLHCYRLHQIQT